MANQNGYSVSIKNSSTELTPREKLMVKDTTDAIKLDAATEKEALVIHPVAYVELAIHNEKSQDKDYANYVILDKDGNKYVTGSKSFYEAFINIFDEMSDSDEDYAIKVYRVPSKNYSGKSFITCSII